MSITKAPVTVQILPHQFDALKDQVAKLNKSLTKTGQELAEIGTIVETTRTITDWSGVAKRIRALNVVVALPALVHNGRSVSFVGKIKIEPNGQKKIFNNGNHPFVLGTIDHSKLTCDHCHKNIARSSWNFFEENGELLHIGSSCAKDYFGWDPIRLLGFYDFLDELKDDQDDDAPKGKFVHETSFDLFAAYVYLATKGFTKWVSKDKAGTSDSPSTSTALQMWIFPSRGMSQEDRDARRDEIVAAQAHIVSIKEELVANLRALPAIQNPRDDFDFNMANSLMDNAGDPKTFISFYGPAAYGLFKAWSDAHSVKPGNTGLNEHFGEVGKRLTLSLTVTSIRTIDGVYGETRIISFKDGQGRKFKSFYSGSDSFEEAAQYNLKGTVKAHGEYKGTKETVLSRIAPVPVKG